MMVEAFSIAYLSSSANGFSIKFHYAWLVLFFSFPPVAHYEDFLIYRVAKNSRDIVYGKVVSDTRISNANPGMLAQVFEMKMDF